MLCDSGGNPKTAVITFSIPGGWFSSKWDFSSVLLCPQNTFDHKYALCCKQQNIPKCHSTAQVPAFAQTCGTGTLQLIWNKDHILGIFYNSNLFNKYFILNNAPVHYIRQGHILKAMLFLFPYQVAKLGFPALKSLGWQCSSMAAEFGGLKGGISCFKRCYFESSHEQTNCLLFHLQCLISCSMK